MARPNIINKQVLIDAAKVCLVEKGIEKFTLKAVAEEAGVTQGTVYYHFRTKEQLLLDVVKDICDRSWNDIAQQQDHKDMIKHALESAKSRCSNDAFFHQLFFTLTVAGFKNEKIREQLAEILQAENQALSQSLSKVWQHSPIDGVSLETWGIFFNALVDGLAIQNLMLENFQVETFFEELEQLFIGLSQLSNNKTS
ncbi:TetR/AcrR family transcriptional regulator [Bacillus sp. FJAT-52991]|uniref:TetR/AcrR family transcriptional regulator n=1 Tax=Bacillus kandeliae TaxID=3129297 RepID=A0ABZ2NAJ9_9BACI